MSRLPTNFRAQSTFLLDYKIEDTAKELEGFCESPVEVAFGTAFMLLGEFVYSQVALHEPGYDGHVDPLAFEFVLKCQHKIGKHRVDFLASWSFDDPASKRQKIIVECDGHNFHERTKEQAQRDRAKDREWQNAGYRVFRFTGSEIYRDAFACATEVFEALCAISDEANGAGK